MVIAVKNITFASNTYLLVNETDRTCLIIDPGLDEELTEEAIRENQLKPVAILATHGHFDHVAGVSFFQEKFGIPFYIHEADVKISQTANFFLKLLRINKVVVSPASDRVFSGAHQQLTIQGFGLETFLFPGHSNGSVVIRSGAHLFTGDILYKRGLGFNKFPGEDKNKLRSSILEIFSIFPDHMMVMPGHGAAAELGDIRNNNTELAEFLSSISEKNV